MTDKQINTCEFLNICQTDCNGTLENTEMCHCYELYKQLKCKEQECEKKSQAIGNLGYKIKNQRKEINICLEQLDQLKAENEELKEKIKAYDEVYSNHYVLIERNKYKQTLAEIKEIAKNSCCLQPTSDCEEYENCKECSRISDDETVKQILQKISEVV